MSHFFLLCVHPDVAVIWLRVFVMSDQVFWLSMKVNHCMSSSHNIVVVVLCVMYVQHCSVATVDERYIDYVPFLHFQVLEVHRLNSSVDQSHLSLVCSTISVSIIATVCDYHLSTRSNDRSVCPGQD